MIRTRTLVFLSTLLLAPFAVLADGSIPPTEWGGSPADVIDKPYLCRGPMTVDDGVEVHVCTMPVLSRDALVNLYFVDGSYACFEVTMEGRGRDSEQVNREFAGLVDHLEHEVGHTGGRDAVPSGEPRATWLTRDETIRATVQWSGRTPLIGIVAMAEEHHRRIIDLISW